MYTVKQIAELRVIVTRIFRKAYEDGLSAHDLVTLSGLSAPTIRNLALFETMYPRLQTVYLLARAVGLTISLSTVHAKKKAG